MKKNALFNLNFKNNYVLTFILAIAVSMVIFIPIMVMNDGYFTYYGDFNAQQIPFYQHAHAMVTSGDFGWDWGTDLGVNFIGSYTFYLLGSPFFWLTTLFDNDFVPYLMGPLLMLKFGVIAVVAYGYLSRFVKIKNTAILGALMYAFCGFNLYNIFFNHFHEAVIAFPLLLIALEELIQNNRRGPFVLAVAFSAITNYYFFFGQVVFILIYFGFRMSDKNFGLTFKKFLVLAFEAVLGVLLASVILLPSIMAITGNSRVSSLLTGISILVYPNSERIPLILSSMFFLPDIPARPNFYPSSDAKWGSVSLFIPLFATSGVFAFFHKKGKHWTKGLLITSLIFALIPILNSMFSAFNSMYYARWFYMPTLIMVLVTCKALENPSKHMKFGTIVTLVIALLHSVIGIMPKYTNNEYVFFDFPQFVDRFWGYMLFTIAGLCMALVIIKHKPDTKHFKLLSLTLLVMMSASTGSYMVLLGLDHADTKDMVVDTAIEGELHLEGDEFYRIDTYGMLDNMGMYLDYQSINAFHSIVPVSIMDFYSSIGVDRGVASRPEYKYLGVRALTNVKYIVKRDETTDTIPDLFSYYDTQLDLEIYKNDYFVPMGVMYYQVASNQQLESQTEVYRDRLMLKAIVLSDEDLEKYNYLPVVSDEDSASYVLADIEDYKQSCETLADNAVYEFTYDSYGFTAKVDALDKGLLFFSVPYEAGFTAYVNGHTTEIIYANNGFMAVEVPKGGSVVEFKYETPMLKLGGLVTLVAFLIFLAYTYVIYQKRKKRQIEGIDKYAHIRNNMLEDIEIDAKTAYIGAVSKNYDVKTKVFENTDEEHESNVTTSEEVTTDEEL